MVIGLVGAGFMGSALGAALREGGHDVLTCLAGRSPRTVRMAESANLRTMATLVDLVAEVGQVIVVTPPAAAVPVSQDLAAAARASGARPLVADLNAISPAAVAQVASVLGAAGLDLVDGAISGPPPTVRPGARIYLSGPRAAEVASLGWRDVAPVVVAGPVGQASAVKMCTASVYKGLVGLLAQALGTAAHHGVTEHVLADLGEAGFRPIPQVAVSATKASRYVPEMREIARTQAGSGYGRELFEAMATVYARLATTGLAHGDPESARTDLTIEEFISLLQPD